MTIVRQDGADGTISCMIGTEPLSENPGPTNAIEFEDYLPLYEKITFSHGETEKVVSVSLVKEKVPAIQENKEDDEHHKEDSEEPVDVIFKIKLEKPDPKEVKISKKNVCLVTIVQSEDNEKAEEDK